LKITGLKTKLIRKSDLERVNVDTTVQEKNVRHPTDARLYHRSIETLVRAAETGTNSRGAMEICSTSSSRQRRSICAS
jgi:hypothetical protein